MRLENLISNVNEKVYERIMDNKTMTSDDAWEVAKKVGLSALKYGDLSNQVSKDYVFDLDRFTAFEGNTGPYLLYTVVRIKSILHKFFESHEQVLVDPAKIQGPSSESEHQLMLKLTGIHEVMSSSFMEYAPHKICQYIYELSNAFNRFYHENKIIAEEDALRQASWIKLITLTREILVTCLDLLGIEVPEKM